MKYIFLTTKKAFNDSYIELHTCGISMKNSLLFDIRAVPQEWSKENLTKKAYNDVYLNKSTFDDDLTLERLQRLYNLILVFKYIVENEINECIIVENIRDFCRMYTNSIKYIVDNYITNHKQTDILFLDNSYKINYSHYKYFGDSFKKNEYVYSKSPAFYIRYDFIKKFLELQTVFYKPFEYTLNDLINDAHIITFFSNKDISDNNNEYTYKNVVVINSGKILLTLLTLGTSIFFYNKFKK